MSSLNKVQIIGRLGRDPESRSFQNGGKVVSLRVATSEKWKDKASGERKERTEWHSVSIFDEGIGKIAERYLKKGALVYVEGQLETRKWQDQSGADRYTTEIVLRPFNSTMRMLSSSGEGGSRGGADGDGGSARYDRKEGDRSQYDQSPGTEGGDQQRSGMDDEIPF